MKRIFKWLIGLFLAAVALAVVAVVVLLLSYNSILRGVIERQIHAATGMDAEIGRFKLALLSSTVEIQNFKLHNSAAYGGTPFLDVPEIHVEFDRDALARRQLHFKLVRFNLGELDIVKNQAGQTNIFLGGIRLPSKKSETGVTNNPPGNSRQPAGGTNNPSPEPGAAAPSHNAPNAVSGNPLADFQKQTGYDFTGIDELNVSIGRVKFIDLQNPQNNREQAIGIDNLVIPNVKSTDDLAGLAVDIALHSNGFFESVFGRKSPGLDALKQLGL